MSLQNTREMSQFFCCKPVTLVSLKVPSGRDILLWTCLYSVVDEKCQKLNQHGRTSPVLSHVVEGGCDQTQCSGRSLPTAAVRHTEPERFFFFFFFFFMCEAIASHTIFHTARCGNLGRVHLLSGSSCYLTWRGDRRAARRRRRWRRRRPGRPRPACRRRSGPRRSCRCPPCCRRDRSRPRTQTSPRN